MFKSHITEEKRNETKEIFISHENKDNVNGCIRIIKKFLDITRRYDKKLPWYDANR